MKLEFPFIDCVSDDKTVLQCSVCSSTFSIASGGKTAITEHLQAQKHKNAMVAKSLSGSLTNYFRKLDPSKDEYDLAVHEGTYVYHTIWPFMKALTSIIPFGRS